MAEILANLWPALDLSKAPRKFLLRPVLPMSVPVPRRSLVSGTYYPSPPLSGQSVANISKQTPIVLNYAQECSDLFLHARQGQF